MNRKNWVFGLMGGIVLALSLAATPARAQATRVRECFTTDLSMISPITNDCTGEVITLTGTMTTCAQAVANGSGGANAVGHVVGQGIGVGSTGDQYVFHIDAAVGIHLGSDGSANETAIASALLIGKGSAQNEVVDVVLHVFIDTNGNVTVIVDKISARCPG
jgi:hypothetical protein